MRLSLKPFILMIVLLQFFYLGGIARIINDANTGDQDEHPPLMKELKDIHDKRVGVLLGSIHDVYAHKNFPEAEILQYNNVSDLLFAVNSEKVDAVFVGKVALHEILKKNPELGVLAADFYFVNIAAGFNSNNDALREQFNRFLKEIRDKGIYKEMVDRWMDKTDPVMPEIVNNSKEGVLRVGVVSDIGLPFIMIKNGKLAGFDIELSTRFAAWLGKKWEPSDMQFGSLIASISTNKIDIIISSMSVTPERAKQIDFSDPYYASGAIVIARKDRILGQDTGVSAYTATANSSSSRTKTFFEKVSESFYNNIIFDKRYLLILDGLRITLVISLWSALLGTILGALICLMRMSKARPVSNIARFIITLIRGIPVLVLLMIIYYIIFASININPVIASIFAFGLNFGAYVSEIFRSGIGSIDPGQNESALASGFSRFQSFRYIVMPQALRPILPVYKGEFISLLKMTSIVGYLAVQDLTKASDIIRSRTFDAFFPLIMVAILYFTLAWLLTLALDYLEISLYSKRRQNRSAN